MLGATLHVLIGYDAQPTGMQLLFYVTTAIAIVVATKWVKRQRLAVATQRKFA